MKQFIPMTDERFYDPESWPGPLVPYRVGVPCQHGLRTPPPGATARAVTQFPAYGKRDKRSSSPN